MLKIALFMPTWNEGYSLRQVLSYYKSQGITDIFLFDNGSTDDTLKIAKEFNCHVSKMMQNELDDRNYLQIKNHFWKDYRDYDFVICCDADEVLYHPDTLYSALNREQTATIIKPQGWNVYSSLQIHKSNVLEISTGFFDTNFSKTVCFDPHEIKEINYQFGAHTCKPTGNVVYSSDSYYLLHIRCIGGVQRMIDRHKAYSERMSDFNKKNGLGVHYLRSEQEIKEEWKRNILRSKIADFIR